MDKQEEGIVSFLRKENAALRKSLQEKEAQLNKLEEKHRGLYLATALKFGTMVGLTQTEMVLNTQYMNKETAEMYDVHVTDLVERNQQIVRVRRI